MVVFIDLLILSVHVSDFLPYLSPHGPHMPRSLDDMFTYDEETRRDMST